MTDSPPPASPIWQWSACDIADAIANKSIDCQTVIEAVVERIAATNTRINAIVDDLSQSALEQAKRRDRELARGGPVGPLHGVPVTIKENVDQAGRATPNGVASFNDVIAPDDAPVVRNLLDAGAIVVGRTNTPEFSFRATTVNELHGATLNPWNEAVSPGGSSGGASAAAAMGYAPINHGNDIGGSLRFPSFACGLSTIRPTLGRVPAYNSSAGEERPVLAQLMSVQGAICREVRDLRLALSCLVKHDPRDPWHVPLPFPIPFEDPTLNQPIKVAVATDPLGYDMHPAISSAIDFAADTLASAGYEVEHAQPPHMETLGRMWMRSTFGEMDLMLGESIRAHGSDSIQQIMGDYHALYGIAEADELIRNMADRTRLLRDWIAFLQQWPIVITPFMMRPMFKLNEDLQGREQVHDIFLASRYSFAMNYLGLPAGIAPTGMAEGAPIAVQIVSRRFREDLILDALQAIETKVGVFTEQLWAREDQL